MAILRPRTRTLTVAVHPEAEGGMVGRPRDTIVPFDSQAVDWKNVATWGFRLRYGAARRS
jgi:hypothetical protein